MRNFSFSKSLEDELLTAKTNADIDRIFENTKVIHDFIRQGILNDIMGNPKTFYDCPNDVEYEMTKEMFLAKQWKYAKELERRKMV